MPMEVILTEDMGRLGKAGDVVRVKSGYGRNYLIPRGKAMLATRGRVQELEHKRRIIEEIERKRVADHQQVAARHAGLELRFEVKAGEGGRLFGSVTTADIARELAAKGLEIDRRRIELREPLKQLGDYEIVVRLHREVPLAVKVQVLAEAAAEAEAEPEAEGAEAAAGGEESPDVEEREE